MSSPSFVTDRLLDNANEMRRSITGLIFCQLKGLQNGLREKRRARTAIGAEFLLVKISFMGHKSPS